MKYNDDCCATCRHYHKPIYCYLMDDIVDPLDNCGMHDKGDN